ncbi:MAG: peptidoglycan bridge formation glycyltransferase FemA/FemB family protein [Planctomycetota bacterium]
MKRQVVYILEEATYPQWDKLLKQCNKTNLLQAWEYGEAKRIVEGWGPIRYVVLDGSEPVGLVQVLNKLLPLFGGFTRINRGPLFLCDTVNRDTLNEIVENTLLALYREIVEKKGYCLAIAPEIEQSEEIDQMLERLGFQAAGGTCWSSSVVDLLLSENDLFRDLRGKWRNLLRKSEKMGLELEQTCTDEAMGFLMEKYCYMQKEKGFAGVPKNILMELRRLIQPADRMQILFAQKNGIRIAGILVVGHGDSCTYLVGWNTPDGRQLQANYFLLWQAVMSFRHTGYRWFDLGGVDREITPNIAHFKTGLGGDNYRLAGEWLAAKHSWMPLGLKVVNKFRKVFSG